MMRSHEPDHVIEALVGAVDAPVGLADLVTCLAIAPFCKRSESRL